MEELRKILYTQEFLEFRKVQIDLLKRFQRLCEEEGIICYAIYGTLLGTVRHKGYIPWDDDIDMAIFRTDEKKLRKAAEKLERPYRFVFTDDPVDFTCNVIRFVNENTTNINFDYFFPEGCYGIHIDIELIDRTFSSSVFRTWKNRLLDLLYESITYKKYGENIPDLSDISQKRKCFIKRYADKHTYKQLLNITEKIHSKGGIHNTECSIYTYKQHPQLKLSWFGTGSLRKFEDILVRIPEQWEECLNEMSGENYMTLPPEETRFPKHLWHRYFDSEVFYKNVLYHLYDFWKVPEDKIFILWGAGNMAGHYVKYFGKKRMPDYIIDNNSAKWGTLMYGCKIGPPDILRRFRPKQVHLLICNIYYLEIIWQIRDMGTYTFFIYLEKYVETHLKEIEEI